MADQKLTQLTEVTSIDGEDLIYTVLDPSGTPLSRGISKENLTADIITSPVQTNPVENEYADITALLADQGNQTLSFFQYVVDASADPNVASGEAYYEKLSTSTTTLATDYRLLSDTEVQVITDSNGYRVFRISDVQDDSTPLTSVAGGRIGFEYDTGGGLVTGILFNSRYTDAILEYYQEDVNFKFYNRTTRKYHYGTIATADWSTVNTNYYHATVTGITASELTVNDRVEFFIDIQDAGGGGATDPVYKTGNSVVFTERANYNFAAPNIGEAITLSATGAVQDTPIAFMVHAIDEPSISGITNNAHRSGNFVSGVPCIYWFMYQDSEYLLNIQPETRTLLAKSTLTVSSGSATQNNTSWTSVTNANNYKLYGDTTNDLSGASELYDGASTSYNHTGLTTNDTWYYWLVAEDTTGAYPRSQYATASFTVVSETTHLTDDFGDASLDTAKWDETTDTNLTQAETGGVYQIDDDSTSASNNEGYITSDNAFSNSGTLVLKADLTKNVQNDATFFMRFVADSGNDIISIRSRSVSNSIRCDVNNNGVNDFGFNYGLSGGISNSFKIVVQGATARFYWWNSTDSVWEFITQSTDAATQSWNVRVGRTGNAVSGNTYTVDDLHCTNYDFDTLNP